MKSRVTSHLAGCFLPQSEVGVKLGLLDASVDGKGLAAIAA